MTDFLKIAKSIAVHFAHICAYGVETVKDHVLCANELHRFNNTATFIYNNSEIFCLS